MGTSFQEEVDAPEYDSIASLAEEAVYRLPGCSDLMIRKTLAAVYRDFCKRGCALVSRCGATLADVDIPILTFGQSFKDCTVDSVTRVFANGRELGGTEWRAVGDGAVRIDRVNESAVYEVEKIEVPSVGVETCPKWFVKRHGDAIVAGTLGRLFTMSGRAWSDPQQAAMCMRDYENAVGSCRSARYEGGGISSGINCFKGGHL